MIYQKYFDKYLINPTRKLYIEKKHLDAVYKSIHCGTSVIGTVVYKCKTCDERHYINRRCGHRFCARCGYVETQKWASSTLQRLSDMKHHHVVFTLPKLLRKTSLINGNKVHDLLFSSSQYIIQDWFKKKYNLKPGLVTVLHTFGSDLKYHPHVHMLVSGGGQNEIGEEIELELNYLTRQRFFANKFRFHFMKRLEHEIRRGEIELEVKYKLNKHRYSKLKRSLLKQQWIVNIEPALKDKLQVIGYVGRYTKRACISEYRISGIEGGKIKFKYNDYANSKRGEKPKESLKEMGYVEFLDNLLQHVPEKGYRMVRYSGMYNSHYMRKKKQEGPLKALELEDLESTEWSEYSNYRKLCQSKGDGDPLVCPKCEKEMEFEEINFTRYKPQIDDS